MEGDGGGGDGFDPCECVWSQDFAMNRLLSLLRNSQNHCTDTECYVDSSQPRQETPADYYIVMSIMLVIYFFMHYWMANRNRNSNDITKPLNGNGSNGGSPRPPPSTT